MKSIIEECRSAPVLLSEIRLLAESLDRPHDVSPEDPRLEYFNLALSVVFFISCVANEIRRSENYDLRGSGALRLAIALGDLEGAESLAYEELLDLRGDAVSLQSFQDQMTELMVSHNLGQKWFDILKKFDR